MLKRLRVKGSDAIIPHSPRKGVLSFSRRLTKLANVLNCGTIVDVMSD